MTVYANYQTLFPDSEEIRHLIVDRHPTLPPDRYSLNESYCADPSCDCQRVLIEAVSATSLTGHAAIFYAFTDDPNQTPDGENPYLEPTKPQGRHAEELLDLVAHHVIENDVAYRKRLERHYREVKQFMVDHPDHDLHRAVAADRRVMQAFARRIVEGMSPSTLPSHLRDRSKITKRKQQRRSRKRNR